MASIRAYKPDEPKLHIVSLRCFPHQAEGKIISDRVQREFPIRSGSLCGSNFPISTFIPICKPILISSASETSNIPKLNAISKKKSPPQLSLERARNSGDVLLSHNL
jgi:hypothetical protein